MVDIPERFMWSYSFLRALKQCPFKAGRQYITRDYPKEPPTPALERGRETHEALERRLNHGEPLPHALAAHEPWAALLAGPRTTAELTLFVDQDFKPSAKAGACGRGTLDALTLLDEPGAALIPDWKTGKVREDRFELDVFAVLLHAHFPELTAIKGMYIWLDHGIAGRIYDLTKGLARTEMTIRRLMKSVREADALRPKPGPLCAWCSIKDCGK